MFPCHGIGGIVGMILTAVLGVVPFYALFLVVMAFMPLLAAFLALPLPSGKHAGAPARASELVPEATGTEVAD